MFPPMTSRPPALDCTVSMHVLSIHQSVHALRPPQPFSQSHFSYSTTCADVLANASAHRLYSATYHIEPFSRNSIVQRLLAICALIWDAVDFSRWFCRKSLASSRYAVSSNSGTPQWLISTEDEVSRNVHAERHLTMFLGLPTIFYTPHSASTPYSPHETT